MTLFIFDVAFNAFNEPRRIRQVAFEPFKEHVLHGQFKVTNGEGTKEGFFGTRHKSPFGDGHCLPWTLTSYGREIIKNGHF